MDIYVKLPKDLKKIIDEMLHNLYYKEVVDQINRVFREPYYIDSDCFIYTNFFNGHLSIACMECSNNKKHIKYFNGKSNFGIYTFNYYYFKCLKFLPNDIINIIMDIYTGPKMTKEIMNIMNNRIKQINEIGYVKYIEYIKDIEYID